MQIANCKLQIVIIQIGSAHPPGAPEFNVMILMILVIQFGETNGVMPNTIYILCIEITIRTYQWFDWIVLDPKIANIRSSIERK